LLNPDKFSLLFKNEECAEYTMSHRGKIYTTDQVESTPINWGMHALQWKGYNHMNDVEFPGGTFDPVLAQSLNPPAIESGGSPDTHNSVSCIGADRIDLLEQADTGIFKTSTGADTDPRGTWNCARTSDPSSAAVLAAMNMFYWKTPTYVDMHVDETKYPDNSNFDAEEKEYYNHGCENLPGFCEQKIMGSWCKLDQSSGDQCGRSLCQGDPLVLDSLRPSCSQLGAVVIKSVKLCIEGDQVPHEACHWGSSTHAAVGDWGNCDQAHLSLRSVKIGSFFNKDNQYPSVPHYSELSENTRTFDRDEWDLYFGNVNGAEAELVFDPPAGTDMAALQEQAQRTTNNLLDSAALDKMFEGRINSKAGTIRGKDNGKN